MKQKKSKPTKLWQFKLEQEIKEEGLKWKKDYRAKKKAEYFAKSTLEQRQQFIKLLKEGKRVGEAAETLGIDKDHAAEIYFKNHVKKTFYVLQELEKVK